ncbi:MAG: peptide chain release factor 1 [Elusimicrobia bacterium RIFOXYA2_FULL_58_8]|nr:MAG: peptide chain release factor 1 [Elusimicrobia bacterium RIFOXYA12_FULL_57_11]OGS13117.1 MAG: peptide chain release factor 1 [Elusimicrobia bacterium RIFOXYA2_FULL_58_8]
MLEEELKAVRLEFAEAEARLSSGALEPADIEKFSRRHAACRQVLDTHTALERAVKEAGDTRQMLSSTDKEIAGLAGAEMPQLEAAVAVLEKKLRLLLIPPDPADSKNIFLEIRAGVGGDESALFAADLLRMYTRFAQNMGWKAELRDISSSGPKGIKNAVVYISGQDVYSLLKYEGGVHRVQRVPQTEASGRVHTSTVTVAIMHEVDEIEIKIEAKDLKVDTFRSGGAGGQNVNKVETAIRITHVPSGIITQCQEERSQGQNKMKAMAMLAAKLAQISEEAQTKANAGARKSQVGTGDRSEKIRTYNFPQNRVTDHRIQVSWHNMPVIMDGGIREMLEEVKLGIGRQGSDEK